VTIEDLTTYFKGERDGGDAWRSAVRDGGLQAWCDTYTVELKPKGVMYHVEVAASDDSSDKDEKVTDDPVEFIVDFLGTGTSGDDFFKNRSSASVGPEELSEVLYELSDGIDEGAVGPRRLACVLRRAMVLTDAESVRRMLAAAIRFAETREDFEVKDLAKLKAEMADKGWKVSVDSDDRDLPVLTVDVGGVYKARVTVDHLQWDYSFEVNGTDGKDSGVTDDPIVAFRNFYRDEHIIEAKREQNQKKNSPKPAQEEGTAPATPRKNRPKE